MQFLYTGAENFLKIQNSSTLSLGGFISSSIVPNGRINNLFGDLSNYAIDRNLFDVIGLALHNNLGNDVTGLAIHFNYPVDGSSNKTSFTILEVAAVIPSDDGNGNKFIESIPDFHSLPYIANFVEADGAGNAAILGNLNNNQYLGIWIKRRLDLAKINAEYADKKLFDNFIANPQILPITQEDISIELNWTDV